MKIENEKINSCKSKLKKIRLIRGFTQNEVAELSGVNIKSIAVYEQEPERINKASVETIILLAESLGCEIDDLIDRDLIMKNN